MYGFIQKNVTIKVTGVSNLNNNFFGRISNNPIIAAVNDLDKLDTAIRSPSEIIFLLTGNIINLKSIVDKVKASNMEICVHIDLIEGFSRDGIVVEYISQYIKPNGIISTRSNLINIAKKLDMFAIQRLFLLDYLSVDTGIKSLHSTKANAVELLPGIMPKVTEHISKETNIPIITGGLIKDKEDVISNLKAGAIGISTSKEEIWYM